jgi:hypothetical protein
MPTTTTGHVSAPGVWYVQICPALGGGHPSTVIYVPAGVPPPVLGTGTSASAVAVQAERSIALPSPVIGLNPQQYSVTGLATWMWVSSSAWHGFSATAAAGGITATAQAIPTSVRWDMGNGDVVVCPGPGVPYQPERPARDQETYCSYTFRTTSAGGQPSPDRNPEDATFIVTATITWAVSWSSSVPGEGGMLPALQTSSSLPVRVEQVQSVRVTG